MPSSSRTGADLRPNLDDPDTRRTALYTAALSGILALAGLFGYVPVTAEGGGGRRHWVRLLTLARQLLRHYPAEVPFFLNPLVLLLLVVLAVPVAAYLLVATWRLHV